MIWLLNLCVWRRFPKFIEVTSYQNVLVTDWFTLGVLPSHSHWRRLSHGHR